MGQRPRWRWTPTTLTVGYVLRLLLGIGISLIALETSLWLVPLGLLLTTSAMRALWIVVAHHAVHGTFSKVEPTNRRVGDWATLPILLPGFDAFRREHVPGHHGARLATAGDPDGRELLRLGFVPGTSVRRLWLTFALALLSPAFHLRFLRDRARASFVEGSLTRRIAALSFHGTLLVASLASGHWLPYVVAWVLPMTGLYHAAVLLQWIGGEHLWFAEGRPGRERIARLTFGRFYGDPPPEAALPFAARTWGWVRWWARTLLLHVPARLLVLPGDLPAHDLHHRDVRSDWANAAYARQAQVERGAPGWPVPYHGVWGSWFTHARLTIEAIAAAKPSDLSGHHMESSGAGESSD